MSNYPAGVTDDNPHFDMPSVGDEDEEMAFCPGYGEFPCGKERDEENVLCDECLSVAQAEERELFAAEMEAEGIKPIVFYEYLTDRE